MTETQLCPCCNQPLNAFRQMRWYGEGHIELVECHNATCDLHMVTMTYDELLKADPAAYRRARQGGAK